MTEQAQPIASPAPVTNDATQPTVPAGTWPGAFGLYKYAKQATYPNAGAIVVLTVLAMAISAVCEWKLGAIGQVIEYAISIFTTATYTLLFLAGVHGKRLSLGASLQQSVPFLLEMLGLELLVGVVAAASVVALIIPAFFVIPRLALANYFLVDQKMGLMDAFSASWRATKGNVMKVYGIFGVTFLMALLMITVIGIPFSIYLLLMYSTAYAVLYEYVKVQQPSALQTPPTDPQPPTIAAG